MERPELGPWLHLTSLPGNPVRCRELYLMHRILRNVSCHGSHRGPSGLSTSWGLPPSSHQGLCGTELRRQATHEHQTGVLGDRAAQGLS